MKILKVLTIVGLLLSMQAFNLNATEAKTKTIVVEVIELKDIIDDLGNIDNLFGEAKLGSISSCFILCAIFAKVAAQKPGNLHYIKQSLYWFHLGSLRLRQDRECYKASAIIDKVCSLVRNENLTQIKKHLPKSLLKIDNSECFCKLVDSLDKKEFSMITDERAFNKLAAALNKEAFLEAYKDIQTSKSQIPPNFAGKRRNNYLKKPSDWTYCRAKILKQENLQKDEWFEEFFS